MVASLDTPASTAAEASRSCSVIGSPTQLGCEASWPVADTVHQRRDHDRADAEYNGVIPKFRVVRLYPPVLRHIDYRLRCRNSREGG